VEHSVSNPPVVHRHNLTFQSNKVTESNGPLKRILKDISRKCNLSPLQNDAKKPVSGKSDLQPEMGEGVLSINLLINK
jgi:hypothetical protein